jgi:hypothetical protein
MEALQARVESMGAGHRERELAKLQELEKTVIARVEDLKKQADDHHAAAMKKADETMTQVEGLHTKMDKLNESGAAFLRALDTGELPPRPAGQSDSERIRFIRSLKRAGDNELPELVHREKMRKTSEVSQVAHSGQKAAAAALTSVCEITKERLDLMEPEDALKKVKAYKEDLDNAMRNEIVRLRGLAQNKAKEAKMAQKKGVKGAKNTQETTGAKAEDDMEQGALAEGGLQGGFRSR